MQSLSVVIITFNEEQNIARCLHSVRSLADEIIVLDSYSTDNTVAKARSLGATVHFEKFRGYIGQKNLAMQYATHNYILSLDADEALDDQLCASIQEEKKSLLHRAYSMNRCTNYCGRFIRHGLWYPDKKIRLFDRRIAKWGGLNPHDKIILQEGFTVCHLKGDILHYSFNTVEDHIWQNNRLSSIAATSLYNAGKHSSWYKMLVRPVWAFVNGYIFRRGFLDRADGFTIAVNTAHQVFLKYSKLYNMQRGKKKNSIPALTKPLLPEKDRLQVKANTMKQ
ncbi:MAG: glycosyltransferase family 2 protein [Chitinophagaceae bacterium]|nr:glycosyltransferase family 2 protein [Chitinophagaceae bacterium]